MKRVDAVVSYRLLTPLAAAVLLAHWVLLQGMVPALDLGPAAVGKVFSTRTVAPTLTVQAPAPVKPAPTRTRPESPPKPVAEPVPAPVEQALAAPAVDAVQQNTAVASPDRTAEPEPVPAAAESVLPAPRHLREEVASASRFVVPGSTTLKYQVSSNKFPFGLNAELGWRRDAESYNARLSFGAFGLSRVQTSRGEVTADGLAPVRFSDKYRSEVAAHFVRDKGKVSFSANTPDAPLLAGAQDRLSIVVQLAAMIAGDPERFPVASTITLQIVGPRDADTWLFTVEGDETLSLPGGEQPTRKLVRNPRREYDQKVELWLAPALGYLPARIRITEANGDHIDQKWLSSEPPG